MNFLGQTPVANASDIAAPYAAEPGADCFSASTT